MEIYLIRHTLPKIAKGVIYGHDDIPLADSFMEEKEAILEQIPSLFDAVYSSPSSRCSQLATAISSEFIADKALYELNFGDWEGMTWDTIDRQECDTWMDDFVNLSPPNGETMIAMEQRIMKFWEELLKQPFQRAAVVTHGGVIRIILAHYRSVALKDSFSIEVGIGEVFKLSVSSLLP